MTVREFYQEAERKLRLEGKVAIYTVCQGERAGEKGFIEPDQREGEVFCETLYDRPRAVILGGGHVSQALERILSLLDFQVFVADSREEFASPARFPDARVYAMDFEAFLDSGEMEKPAYYVIVTRGHEDDDRCLRKILKKKYEYIGMIGSRRKTALCLEGLKRDGYLKEQLREIHAPVGLRINAKTPAEIAVSIAGEMIAVKNQEPRTILEGELCRGLYDKETRTLVTILKKQGSSPRGRGSRMAVRADGGIYGTIGGGAVEAAAIEQARSMEEAFAVKTYDLSGKEAASLGMVCGGQVTVMFEKLETQAGDFRRV